MAEKIQVAYDTAAVTLYVVVRDSAGQAYRADTQVFEAYATANLTATKYAIALTEQGTASRYYTVSFPTAITTQGTYAISVYKQVGGSPAETDTLVTGGSIDWDGAKIITFASLARILGTAPTEGGAGRLAGAFTKFFDKATPTGTINSIPDAVAGAANGLTIAGTNAATTFATLTVTGAVAFQSTFAVTTSTALAALSCTTLTASGAVAFQSTFAVTTSTSLAALSATTVTFSGAVAFQSTFAVTTSTALGALSATTVTFSGAVAFQSTFAVTTSTSLAALSATTITASGTVSLAAVTTSGTVTLSALTITNNLLVSGTSTFTGAVTMTAGLAANITGNLTGTVSVVTAVTNQLTAAAISTAIWQDTTASDFTTALSVGKSIMNGVTLGTGLTVNSVTGGATAANQTTINNNVLAIPTNPYTGTPPTVAQIATGVWQDATAGDFTTAGSIGKSLGGSFSALGTSVFTAPALANAPSGTGASAASIATAVWQDTTASSDFSTAGSIGLLLKTDIDAAISSRTKPADTQAAVTVVNGLAAGVITASSIASDAITDAKVASDVTIASVTGAVGSVAGNVVGSVGSIAAGGITAASFAAGAIDAAAIATDAIGANELAASAITEIAGGVWDLATSGHTGAGSFGAAMGAAGAAGDPWITDLPGSYVAGQAGYLIGNPSLTVAERNAVADAILDRANGVETGITPRGCFRVMLSGILGLNSGIGTGTEHYRDAGPSGNTKDRIVVVFDSSKNRIGVTLITS